MPATATIAALLADAQQSAAEEAQGLARVTARYQWALRTFKEMMAAQDRVGEAWSRIFDSLPDDLDEDELEKLPEPPEQAELDRLYALIAAMRDHDRWPRELHWHNV